MRTVFYIVLLLTLALPPVNAQTANAVGSASDIGGDCFSITPNQQNQNGAVWYSDQLDLSQYFSLTVELNLGTNDWDGADGIMLVMQQVGLDALGEDGQGMGFSGFSPSLGVEFDTFTNDDNGDPATDHMAIHINGTVNHASANNLDGPVAILEGGLNAENGQTIEMRLVWNPAEQEVKVFTNCNLRLSANIDLINSIFAGNSLVYWGFTGATGFYTNSQTVCFIEATYLNPPQEFDICEGDDVTLSIESVNPDNVIWSPNDNISDVNSLTPTVAPIDDVTYTVSYEECGESFTDSYIFNVSSLELEPISNQAVCPGESQVFSAVTNPSYDILWSSNSSNINQEEYSEAGIHWVEVTDGLCTKREEFELSINPVPVISVPSTVEYCTADSTLVLAESAGADLYMPEGNQGDQFYASAEQSYELLAIDQVTGCESTAQVDAIELPLPVIPFSNYYEICPYETLELSLTSDYDVSWSNSSFENTQVFESSGEYTVSAELNGCTSESSFTLTVNPLPASNVPGLYEFCEDDSLIVSNLNPNHVVLWPSGETSNSFRFLDSGTYNVTITDTVTGCIIVETVSVEKKFNPVITLEESYDLCVNDFIIIEPEVEYATELMWSNGSNDLEQKFTEPEPFSVSASNDCSTEEVYSEVKYIICDCIAYIPSAFTPDGDGINETFVPQLGCSPIEYQFEIYNRWGHAVFSSEEPSESWNGSFNNGTHFVSPGVYTYKMSYSSEQFDGIHTETKYGMISVLR